MTGPFKSARILPWAAAVLLTAGTIISAGGTPVAAARATAQPHSVPTGLGGRVWNAIPTHAKVVALTFDAGANADGVASILHTLSATHTAASFFLTGNFAKSFPADAKAMAAAGRVGDHSVSHPYFTKLTDAQIRQQVLGAQQTITSTTGVNPAPWFRFPYGDYNAHTVSVVNSVGFVPVGWTVDTLGWEGTSGGITTAKIVSRVLGSLQPGEIVLMHCGSNPDDQSTLDADALPSVISQLQARGYQFVTLDALRGLGYHLLTSDGGTYSFGAPAYGGPTLATGVKAVGIATDQATGGYWILRSDGGVENVRAPWHGSLRGKVPAGQSVTGIAASPKGGYLVLASGGGVYPFGAPAFGSAAGTLPGGVTATGLAIDPVTGGYWILKSNGGVANYNAPWYGSLTGKIPAGQSVTAIAGA